MDLSVGALQHTLRQAAREPPRQLEHHRDEHDDLAGPADRARDPGGIGLLSRGCHHRPICRRHSTDAIALSASVCASALAVGFSQNSLAGST